VRFVNRTGSLSVCLSVCSEHGIKLSGTGVFLSHTKDAGWSQSQGSQIQLFDQNDPYSVNLSDRDIVTRERQYTI